MWRNAGRAQNQCNEIHPDTLPRSGPDDVHLHSPFGAVVKEGDYRPSQVAVRQDLEGRVCAGPPDWANHPLLKKVPAHDRRVFREVKITEWLELNRPRGERETLAAYITRCIAAAEHELRKQKRIQAGDEFPHMLDKLVFRLFYGTRIQQQVFGITWPVEKEELILQFLREECDLLLQKGALHLDPLKFNHPSTSTWPNPDDTDLHEATKVPRSVDTLGYMNSRSGLGLGFGALAHLA